MSIASSEPPASFTMSELHIDVARNACDDFNLFHDKRRWQQIQSNPFGGPIALGFQLIQFIEHHCSCFRSANQEDSVIIDHQLGYSNYQFNFISVVRPGQTVSLHIKPTKLHLTQYNPYIANRVVLKADNAISLIGFKSHSQQPLFGQRNNFVNTLKNATLHDRKAIDSTPWFYKRKFSTNSDAKNFLISGGVDQADYFDDLADINNYTETYCCGLLSCALLERAKSEGLSFVDNPMVYTQQEMSVHTDNLRALRSAQPMHYIVDAAIENTETQQQTYRCWALNQDYDVLVQAELSLAPLLAILAT